MRFKYFNSQPSNLQSKSMQEKIKETHCPNCQAFGNIHCHGKLKGYRSSGEEIVRGLRFFCSKKYQKKGCGTTFSAFFSNTIKKHTVSSQELWRFLLAFLTTKKASKAMKVLPFFKKNIGKRWLEKIKAHQIRLRENLSRLCSAFFSDSDDPLYQTILHLKGCFPEASCPIESYQLKFQEPFLIIFSQQQKEL